MSNNIEINPPSIAGGPTLSTENIGGVMMPRGKIALGATGVDGGDVTAANPFPVMTPYSENSNLTQVPAATASTSLLAVNTLRKGAVFWNTSTATLYLALSATASTTAYTVQIPTLSGWVLPYPYQGAISGVWGAAVGNVQITELS